MPPVPVSSHTSVLSPLPVTPLSSFDFNFEAAEEWYKNLDKLIHYVNLNTSSHGINMFYSTPSIYTDDKLR